MLVSVKLFARAKDIAGVDTVSIEVPEQATVAEVRQRLASAYPALKSLLWRSALAVNNEFADDATVLPANAELALLPPVSGG
jgi:molybdopterin converting factor subunit 1